MEVMKIFFALLKKILPSIILLVIFILPGCKASSISEEPQPHIDLIEQLSKASMLDSRKFHFQDYHYINFNDTAHYKVKDSRGEQYAIGVNKITPLKHGTIELQFRFLTSQEHEAERNLKQGKSLATAKEAPVYSEKWVSAKGIWTQRGTKLIGRVKEKHYANPAFRELGFQVAVNPNVIINKTAMFKNGLVKVKFNFSDEHPGAKNNQKREMKSIAPYAGICFLTKNDGGFAILVNDSGYVFLGLLRKGVLSPPPANLGKYYIEKIPLKPLQGFHELQVDINDKLISISIDNAFVTNFSNPLKESDAGFLGIVSANGSDKYVAFEKPFLKANLSEKIVPVEREMNKNNFAGIGIKTINDDNYFIALLHESGKLTFGKLGDPPIVSQYLHLEDKKEEVHKLKISFLRDHVIIFLDREPPLFIKDLPIENIEEIAIVEKKHHSLDRGVKINIVTDSFKYRPLNSISAQNSKNTFRFLEEENALSSDYYTEEGYMNLFVLSPEVLKEKNNAVIFIIDATIKSETRKGIFAPAPTRIKYLLTIPPKSYLNFGYAIAPSGWDKSDGMLFSVLFKPENSETKRLFSHFLDQRDPQNRKWFEQRVDLSSLSGVTGELILETLPYDDKTPSSNQTKGDEYFDFGLWGSPSIYSERDPDQLNVILISLDTLRADHLGAYGYFRNTSPNIDKIAKNGVFFQNTITQAPWTLPSHMSMLTSLYPSQLGYSIMNRIERKFKMPEKAITLAEILKENGYLTAGFTGGANVSKVFGFHHGFSFYNERWKRDIDLALKNISDWVQKHRKDKFFLFFHTYEIHDFPPGEHEIFTDGINPLDEINYKKALYDGKIKYVDDYIGLLIEKLRSLNLLNKTLIVITSDHGEAFYEHGLTGHGDVLYDEVLRVPLIFHLDGIVPRNKAIDNQVRVIDIMPTILDILSIPPPKFIEGTSLVPFFKKNARTNLIAFTEATNFPHDNRITIIDYRSLRMLEYKYIYYPEIEENLMSYLKSKEKETGYTIDMYNQEEGELYNLIEDPGELTNIIKLKSSIASDLRKEIESFMEKSSEKDFTKDEKHEKVKIDKVTLERLKSLGYIQ